MMPAGRQSRTYFATNEADAFDLYDPHTAIFSPENLRDINPAKLPRHELRLVMGMPVMCMKNLDVPNGICNGSIMIVEKLDPDIVWCRINTRYGQRLHPFAPTKFVYKRGGFRFTRTQLPLRVAFCATINRAQGGTYDKVGYYAMHPIWAHGQLYTAITRVTSAVGLAILCDPLLMYTFNGETLPTTRNVVHPRVSGRTEHIAGPTTATQPHPNQPAINEEEMYGGPAFEAYNNPLE
jgi:hypothetical protein